jgi:TrwC relaxase
MMKGLPPCGREPYDSGVLSVSFGSEWRYLQRHGDREQERSHDDDSAGAMERDHGEATGDDRPSAANYYLDGAARGEPPGRWWGRGSAILDLAGEVDEKTMALLYGEESGAFWGRAAGTATGQ